MAIDLSSLPDDVDLKSLPDKADLSNLPDKEDLHMVHGAGSSRQDPEQSTFNRDKTYKPGEEIPPVGKAWMALESAAGGYYLPQLPGQIIKLGKAVAKLPETVEEAVGWIKNIVKETKKATDDIPLDARSSDGVDPAAELKEIFNKVVKDASGKVLPESSKSAEHLAIDAETAGSQSPRVLGVHPALVDSSSKMRGTLEAPALKPEILPGTRSFSHDIWNRLVTPAAEAVAKQGPAGMALAQDLIKVRDVPAVRYGMEFGANFEKLYNQIPEVFTQELAKGLHGIEEAPTQERVTQISEKIGNEIRSVLEGKSFESDLPSGLKILRSQMAEEAKAGLKRISDWAQVADDGQPIKIHRTIWEEGEGGMKFPKEITVDWAPRDNYFPRVVKPDMLEALVREDPSLSKEAARHLVVTGQSPKMSTAMEQIRLFRKNLLDRKFGNIERSREMDLPSSWYETNAFKVIPQYMRTAYQRLSEIETYGMNDWKALAKIQKIADDGGDADLALRSYRRITGRDPIDAIAKGAFTALRNWATASNIQFQTTLYHLPRTVYPAMEAGYYRAIKGFINSFGEASELESRRMGINLNQAMSEFLQSEYGGGKGMSGKMANATMTIEGIKPLDRFDRKFSGIVGKDWIKNDLVKAILKPSRTSRAKQAVGFADRARTQLQDLGIDPDKIIANKGISDEDLNLGAKRFSDRNQGAPDATTLPLWWTSPAGKMYAQYKNFIYVISREMGASISRAAKTGDAGALARYATLPMAGATVYGIRHDLGMRDTQYVKDPKMNMALNILRDTAPIPVGVDVFFKVLQGRKGVQDLLLPPALSNVADIVGDIGTSVRQGKVTKATERDLARHIPLVGTAISHEIK